MKTDFWFRKDLREAETVGGEPVGLFEEKVLHEKPNKGKCKERVKEVSESSLDKQQDLIYLCG